MRLNVDYMDLDSLFEQFQAKVPDCEKLTRNEVKQFEAIFHRLAEVSNGGWISVKDRLPEDGDAYIVAGKKRYPGEPWEYFTDIAASHGRYIDGFWDTFNDWIEGNEVHITHWMPFPEPPKEEENAD